MPVRPSIPVLAWPAVGIWCGVYVAESVAWTAWAAKSGGGLRLLWVVLALVVTSAGLSRRVPAASLAALGVAIGLAAGGLYWARWASDVASLDAAGLGTVVVETTADATVGRFGSSQDGRIGRRAGAEERHRGSHQGQRIAALQGTPVRLQWQQDFTAPELGYVAEGSANYKAPGLDERGRRAHRDGVRGTLSMRSVRVRGPDQPLYKLIAPLRHRWHERLATLSGAGAGIVDGVVLGDRRRMSGTVAEEALRTCGLTHLVAVSGGHLVVLAALVTAVLGKMPLHRGVVTVVVLAVCGVYVIASGAAPSAIRAFAMACIASAATGAHRRGDASAGLAATVCGFLVWDPSAAFDLGFALSVAAVAGLVVFSRYAEYWIECALPRLLRAAAGPLGMTMTAQASTAPLTIPVFGMVSVVAPVANIGASALISFVLGAGIVGLIVGEFWPVAGGLLLQGSLVAAALCERMATWFASWPGAAVPLGARADVAGAAVLAACAAIWTWWPRPTKIRAIAIATGALMLGAATVVGPRGPTHLEIRMLDVGQGDAILVRANGEAGLVDTGASKSRLTQALARAGVRRLDWVLLTHGHEDHAGGLGALRGLVPVDTLFVSADAEEPIPKDGRGVASNLRRLTAGDAFSVGSARVTVVWPTRDGVDPEGNDASLVVLVERSGFGCLLTGDAESEVLEQLVRSRSVGDIDVLKVGHHGSAAAVSPSSLEHLRPELAVITVGAGNRFGHPTPSTLSELAAHGVRVERTDLAGDIIVEVRSDGRYRVRRQRETAVQAPSGRSIESYPYATLVAAFERLEDREPRRHTTQTRLPDLRNRGAPARAGPVATAHDGRRRGRSRLQLGHVRR